MTESSLLTDEASLQYEIDRNDNVPRAGLFKGSTMTLDNTGIPTTYPNNRQYHPRPPQPNHALQLMVNMRPERPKTLRTSTQLTSAGNVIDKSHLGHASSSSTSAMPAEDTATTNGTGLLSPFDEQEEWAKISEIMATFGTGFIKDSVFATETDRQMMRNSRLRQQRQNATVPSPSGSARPVPDDENDLATLTDWLFDNELQHLEAVLIEHGFDDVQFINGILEESDLATMGVSEADSVRLMAAVQTLNVAFSILCRRESTASTKNNNNINGQHNSSNNCNNNNHIEEFTQTVDEWLNYIKLNEYADVFKKHLYTDMERISRVWEIELQTVLEITKLGHRRRILRSVIERHNSAAAAPKAVPVTNSPEHSTVNDGITTLKTNIMQLRDDLTVKVPGTIVAAAAAAAAAAANDQKTLNRTSGNGTTTRTNHGKNRPAPQPPNRSVNLEIREPAELLLGVPVGLQTNWRHTASALVSGFVKYQVNYLGSTVVKELRGTESTRKSIQKLKREERVQSAAGSTSSVSDAPASAPGTVATPSSKRPLYLSISHRGVQFIDIQTESTICEHEIRNIDCACQDSDDLSHFAYITKDSNLNTHYCHVFNVDSMDLATTIILTLGQAFEVAYQLALRENTPTTPIRSPVSGPAALPTSSAINSTRTVISTPTNGK